LRYLGGGTYEVAISGQGVRVGTGEGIVLTQQKRATLSTHSLRCIKRRGLWSCIFGG
jgi:hypothetical protein